MSRFRENILNAISADLERSPQALALWEGGAAANGTQDQYSDIDLLIVGSDSIDVLFDVIEATLNRVSRVTHRMIEPKTFWPGCYQRIYFLENAPKHFFVDVAVILQNSKETLSEFLEIERHGTPAVHFDKRGLVKPGHTCPIQWKEKQKKRLAEIEEAFPIYKIEVLKEFDRNHPIDAFAFYFAGMIRPLVEIMGMLHRPFRFDFGLRYLHRTFPEQDQRTIENLLYVKGFEDLEAKALEAHRLFEEIRHQVREKLDY
jgi:predicted nucleotidyltransferase